MAREMPIPVVCRIDQSVDADKLAARIDQCAARVAGVDHRVGLNQFLESSPSETEVAAQSRDNALRDRVAEAQRVADRQHHIADREGVRVGQFNGA